MIVSAWLDVTPIAVEHVLTCVDETSSVGDCRLIERVGRHRPTFVSRSCLCCIWGIPKPAVGGSRQASPTLSTSHNCADAMPISSLVGETERQSVVEFGAGITTTAGGLRAVKSVQVSVTGGLTVERLSSWTVTAAHSA